MSNSINKSCAGQFQGAYSSYVNIGFGNIIKTDGIVAIVSPESSPIKRLVQDAKDKSKVIDATQGRRTRSVIITESSYIVLSYIQPETIAARVGYKAAEVFKDLPDSEENEDSEDETDENNCDSRGDGR